MEASNLIGYDGCFATRLRELMKKSKVTQQDLAAAVGTTRQAISQYADGSVQPNIEKLYKIAEFFHVSADYLLGMSDTQSCDMEIREICKITGLTEHSIEKLHHETKWICEFGKSNNPQEALKHWLSMSDDDDKKPFPKFHTINLLLADSPINLNYEPIIETLGEILAFRRQPKNIEPDKEIYYGLFKNVMDIADVENDEPVFDTDAAFPSYFLGHNELLEVLLLKLQGTIKRYKDENDKDSNI